MPLNTTASIKDSQLVSAHRLQQWQAAGDCVIVDCRFQLTAPDAGYEEYLKSHIPGAVYAHLDDDLSCVNGGGSGRHPLPDASEFAEFLGRSGWRPGKLLVAYDDGGGSIAARLWWLMKYFGHDCAALLDGGIQQWVSAGYRCESGQASVIRQAAAKMNPSDVLVMNTNEVAEGLENKRIVLVDARAHERFIGEVEPIDPVGGHIPGAVNYPLELNLDDGGKFRPAEEIRVQWLALKGCRRTRDIVHMCGSGVTACLNLFAAELAGLEGSRLYVDSWSGWIEDPTRPVAKK